LTLNKESFYTEQGLTHKWMRLDESVTEFKVFKLSEQIMINQQN